jgi:serine/threonine protein kinase
LYRQVLDAIQYLHHRGVCHRDIKPSNILITKDRQRVYLADFNVSTKIKEGETEFKMYTKSAGTLAFVAPERLKEQ